METTRLHHHGRIDLGCHPSKWRQQLLQSGLREVPIDGQLLVEAVLLMDSGFHKDPVDQMIVATAILAGMTLATFDREIIAWAAKTHLVPIAQVVDGIAED